MKFDCTPEQYHHGLDILWKALNNPPMDGRTVYARIADRIAELEAEIPKINTGNGISHYRCDVRISELEAEVERVRGLLKDSYHAINVLTKRCEEAREFITKEDRGYFLSNKWERDVAKWLNGKP